VGRDPDNSAEDPFEGVDLDDAFVKGASFREPAASERARSPLPYLDLREDRINDQLHRLMQGNATTRRRLKSTGQFSVPWALLVIIVLGASFLWPRPRDGQQETATPAAPTSAAEIPVIEAPGPDDPESAPGRRERPSGDVASESPPAPTTGDELAAAPPADVVADDQPTIEFAAGQARTIEALGDASERTDDGEPDAVIQDDSVLIAADGRALAGIPIPVGVVVVEPPPDHTPTVPTEPKDPDPGVGGEAPPPKPADDVPTKPGKKPPRGDKPSDDRDVKVEKRHRDRDRDRDRDENGGEKDGKTRSDGPQA